MFQYDNATLADILWEDYTKVVKENILLRAQLEVAKKVTEALQVQIGDMVNPSVPPTDLDNG